MCVICCGTIFAFTSVIQRKQTLLWLNHRSSVPYNCCPPSCWNMHRKNLNQLLTCFLLNSEQECDFVYWNQWLLQKPFSRCKDIMDWQLCHVKWKLNATDDNWQCVHCLLLCWYSALYVVDLRKFRRIAAGDRLRGQYQGLSQDPNSLSNLDQVVNRALTVLVSWIDDIWQSLTF